MRLHFAPPRSEANEGVLAEAEIHFDDGTPMAGMKIVGITVRKNTKTPKNHPYYITVPSRPFGVGAERKYFEYIRTVKPPAVAGAQYAAFRKWIIAGYEAWKRAGEYPAFVVVPAETEHEETPKPF